MLSFISSDRLHFKSSGRCALCREDLPEPSFDSGYEPQTMDAWKYKVLGICDLSNTNTQFGVIAIPVDLTDPDILLGLSVLSKSGIRSPELNFCLSSTCRICQVDKIVHFIHLDCWKLVNSSNTVNDIYNFARSTYPIFTIKDTLAGRKRVATDFTYKFIGYANNTEVGQLLFILSYLPAEIQVAISIRCTQNLLFSLIVAKNLSSHLGLIKRNHSNQDIMELRCNSIVETIHAQFISVFGQSYISLLELNVPRKPNTEACLINIGNSVVKGIKFVIDHYGLRGISVLYTDDSSSAWLGDQSGGWKGVIYGNSLRRLRITRDDLKYLRIDFMEPSTMPRDLVMWDKDLHFAHTQSSLILDVNDKLQSIRCFPGWRLCRYLSFIDIRGYVSGLTMYCDRHSVTGIVAHGKSNRLIGHRQGCPIYFHLQHGEYIESLWLRTPADPSNIDLEPAILVTTSLHRSCLFGPYLFPSVIDVRRYAWTCLTRHSGSNVIGVFYDALSVSPLRRIRTFGVTQDDRASNSLEFDNLPRVPVAQDAPGMRGDMSMGLYISIANFAHIQQLKLRRVQNRCTGLCIYHDDDSVEVLGQWDPSQVSQITEIYNQSQGILKTINFHSSESTSSSYIDDITVGLDNPERPEKLSDKKSKIFHANMLNQYITWWFTAWYDYVELWNGTWEVITVSNLKHRTLSIK